MSAMASQITGVSIVCPTVCLGADQRKHQSSLSLATDSPHQGPATNILWNHPMETTITLTEMLQFEIHWGQCLQNHIHFYLMCTIYLGMHCSMALLCRFHRKWKMIRFPWVSIIIQGDSFIIGPCAEYSSGNILKISNNFKYSYLIYWAFMFLPQLGCYGLRRNLRRDWNFLSNSNHDKKLVSEIDCSCRYIFFFKSM